MGRWLAPVANLVIEVLTRVGFANYRRPFVHGPPERLHLAESFSTNAFFNTRSGHIHVGRGTVISHGAMFLTGRHEFPTDGSGPGPIQVPESGHDIHVGADCWIATGAIVAGGVTIGERCIVAAGAVVTSDVADGEIVAGVPARPIGRVQDTAGRGVAPAA